MPGAPSYQSKGRFCGEKEHDFHIERTKVLNIGEKEGRYFARSGEDIASTPRKLHNEPRLADGGVVPSLIKLNHDG